MLFCIIVFTRFIGMKTIVIVLFVSLSTQAICQQKSSWQIWITPKYYTINLGDTLEIHFGLTGFGPLKAKNVKITAYSEAFTTIKIGKVGNSCNTAISPKPNSPQDEFERISPRFPNNIILVSDYITGFEPLFLIPSSPGNKKLILIATYSPDGVFWYTTSTEFSYHVNSFFERYQIWFYVASLVLALFSLQFVGLLVNCIERKRRRRRINENHKGNTEPKGHPHIKEK